ncbi:DUF87 domain-containing protein [Candidatus Marsarchaeota archaeon]|nr:DUF87 domain-containing protein [Candidatus Marsarchaeota archaeon]
MTAIIPTSNLSNKLAIFEQSEKSVTVEDDIDGVYLGKSSLYRLPVSYNSDSLINPHIAIIGTSGSGKTNMMLNLIMKFAIERECRILIIDWSGEYLEIAKALGIKEGFPTGHEDEEDLYVNLSGFAPEKRVKIATMALDSIAAGFSAGFTRKLKVIVDEVWHFLGDSDSKKSVATIFREGRKHGIGIIAATQLSEDVDNDMIYNSGTIMVFRLYGSSNLSSLENSMLLDHNEIAKLKELEQGSCYCIMMQKSGYVQKLTLDKIQKFETKFFVIQGDGMEWKTTKRELLVLSENTFGKDMAYKIEALVSSNIGVLSLGKLTCELMKDGCERPKIVYFLRKLGIPDTEIASSIFNSAMEVKTG